MKMSTIGTYLLFAVSLLQPTEAALKKAAADPAKDPDFALQGEYTGTIEGDGEKFKVGIQVIAKGDGKFHGVYYPGGLPGDGWDKTLEKKEADGKLEDGKVVFQSDSGTAVLKKGVIKVQDPDGNDVGTLKKVVRKSPTLGAKPPEGAVVLFDGKSADNFKNGKLEDGLLREGCTSKQTFQDCQVHLEFRLSWMPKAGGQGRSNSGCYLQGRYEVQILDSFGLKGKHNECGGIYSVGDPAVNMCFPPMSWQTYDIDFTAAKFDENGKKTSNARMTVKHNGITVQDDVEVDHSTTASPMKEGASAGPIFLQHHGNKLWFRNIWVKPKKS